MLHLKPQLTLRLPIVIDSIFSAGLWGTTLTEDNSDNREQFMRTTLRELLVYLVFLVDICLRKCTLIVLTYCTHLMYVVFIHSTCVASAVAAITAAQGMG